MDKQFDTNKIKEYLNKICSNETFDKSSRYTRLLTFLVDQAIEQNDLKEHTIGIELYEQNYNTDKNDGIVRVYMYNLRKKLKTYYENDGKYDAFIFTFEKGSYNLKFVTNKIIKEQPTKNQDIEKQTNNKKWYILLAITAIIGLLSYYLIPRDKLYCWEAFLQKNGSNTCILADQIIMSKKGAVIGNLITHKDVNSSSDFITYTKEHSEESLELSDYTFFTKAIPYSVNYLSRFFATYGQAFSPIPESEFRYEEIKKNNIIYIGQYKTMNVSKEIFLRNSKIFKADYNSFIVINNGKESIFKAEFNDVLRAEYAMVSYIPLSNGKKALYFVSNNDIGTMATINNFTDLEFLNQFYKKLPSPEAYYNALFKVEGVDRSDINCELVALEIVDK